MSRALVLLNQSFDRFMLDQWQFRTIRDVDFVVLLCANSRGPEADSTVQRTEGEAFNTDPSPRRTTPHRLQT